MKSIQLVVFMCMSGVHHSKRHPLTLIEAEAAKDSIALDIGQRGSFAEIDNQNYFNAESDALTNRKTEVTSMSTDAIKDRGDVSGGLTSNRRVPFVDDCPGWSNALWIEQLEKTSPFCYTKVQDWENAQTEIVGPAHDYYRFGFDPDACSEKEFASMTSTNLKCKLQLAKILIVGCPVFTNPTFLKGLREIGAAIDTTKEEPMTCDKAFSDTTKERMIALECGERDVINPDMTTSAAGWEQACKQGEIDWGADILLKTADIVVKVLEWTVSK